MARESGSRWPLTPRTPETTIRGSLHGDGSATDDQDYQNDILPGNVNGSDGDLDTVQIDSSEREGDDAHSALSQKRGECTRPFVFYQ